ncbi:MAG: hypothetical protein K2L22_05505 [Muribaculaceae bacterium]|nr:hypothetical protein [Muribaculaceae bacterium]
MDNKDRQEMENKAFNEMRRAGKNLEENRQRKDVGTQNSNRLWVWLGVLVLIFILIYWLFAIGTFGDLANWFNG